MNASFIMKTARVLRFAIRSFNCTARPLAVATIFSCIFAPTSYGYGSTQWEWRVAGISEPFATKELAHEALLALGGDNAYLDKEEGLNDLSAQWATYKYSVRPRDAQPLTNWSYVSGNLEFSTEAALKAAVLAITAETLSHPNCPAPILTPRGDWVVTTDFWGMATGAEREFDDIRYGWDPETGCVQNAPLAYRMNRIRSVGCEAPFSPDHTAQKCMLAAVGYIETRPLVLGRCTQNPCDVTTGSKSQTEIDYGGPGPQFVRNYHSLEPHSTAGLGVGWTHNYSQTLTLSSGQPSGLLTADGYVEPLAARLVFVNGGYEVHWISRTGSGIRVEQDGTEFVLFKKSNTRERFNASGRLIKLIDRNGQETSVIYDSAQRISEVRGPFGHKLTFHFAGDYLTSVDGPGGVIAQFSRDVANNLQVVSHGDGSFRTYLYEDTNFPNHLTGITGEDGVRYKSVTYDSAGRVLTSDIGAGQERVTLSYTGTTTTVLDASGGTRVFGFTSDENNFRKVSSEQHGTNVTIVFPPRNLVPVL